MVHVINLIRFKNDVYILVEVSICIRYIKIIFKITAYNYTALYEAN